MDGVILQERFVSRVIALRDLRGWSDSELARRMGKKHSGFVCDYLKKRYSPGFDVQELFANALGVDPGVLTADEFDLEAHRELLAVA